MDRSPARKGADDSSSVDGIISLDLDLVGEEEHAKHGIASGSASRSAYHNSSFQSHSSNATRDASISTAASVTSSKAVLAALRVRLTKYSELHRYIKIPIPCYKITHSFMLVLYFT